MPEFGTIRVSYLREKQPVQYEKAAPAVELSAGLLPGEDPLQVGIALMRTVTQISYAALGLTELPKAVADALDSYEVPEGGEIATDPTTPAPAKGKRGRKPSTPPSTSEAPTAPAATGGATPAPAPSTAETSSAPATPPAQSAPPADATPPSTPPAASTAPAAAPAEPPKTAAASAAPAQAANSGLDEAGQKATSSAKELQAYISGFISKQKLTMERFKEILNLVSNGAALKTTDLDDAGRVSLYTAIRHEVEGGAAGTKPAFDPTDI